MSNIMTVPLVNLGPGDEVGDASAPAGNLPAPKNFALDEGVAERVRNQLAPILFQTRNDRQNLEEEWKAIRRMEMMKHDSGRRYFGRSDAYLPVYPKIVNTTVAALAKGLFPSDDYMDVIDRGDKADDSKAKAVKAGLLWNFDRVARLRTLIKPFLRQFENFGTSVFKYRYKKESKKEGRSYSMEDALSGKPEAVPSFRTISQEGLSLSVRSLFYWYIYPATADSLDEAEVVFEDIDVPLNYVVEMAAAKKWVNTENIIAGGGAENSQHDTALQENLSDIADMQKPTNSMGGNPMADMRTITEVWCKLKLPKEGYAAGEDTYCAVPSRVVMCGETVLEVTRNPHWTQRPPYLVSRQNVQPGFFYGYGRGRMVRSIQYLANDFANQTNDNGIYALNPIVKYVPGMLAGPLRPIAPGVAWPMTDLKAVEFDRPPHEQVQMGSQMLNMWIGMAQDAGGAPPILQGQNAGKGGRTATQAQILQKNAFMPIQDTVEDIELDVLVPLMYNTWVLMQQYMEDDLLATIGGGVQRVTPADLAIDAEFRWLASSQSVNAQLRAQQAMQLIQASMPLVPLLAQQGYVVDYVPLIQKIYTDGFGFRGFEQFIKRGPPPQMPMAGGMGGPPGQPPIDEGNMRSALDQNGGGPVEMAPGEGEDFSEVRDNADEMAGAAGAAGII